MNITAALIASFRRVIVANELDNDLNYALKFSDPDGVRSGKSGWSFGVCQFDTQNNPAALQCLAECGFTPAEIAGIRNQTIDVHQFEHRLNANAAIVEKWDRRQLSSCLTRADYILDKYGITPADDAALLAVADYDNQYHLSDIDKVGTLVHGLKHLGVPFTAKDVLQYKLSGTKYGREHPGDCKRRYDNLVEIMAA
jgi:hypothetical protein